VTAPAKQGVLVSFAGAKVRRIFHSRKRFNEKNINTRKKIFSQATPSRAFLIYILLERPLHRNGGNRIEAIVLTVSRPNEVVRDFQFGAYAPLGIVVDAGQMPQVHPELRFTSEHQAAVDAIVIPQVAIAREAQQAFAEVKAPHLCELCTMAASAVVIFVRQILVHQLYREGLAEVLTVPVPSSAKEIGVIITIGSTLEAAVVLEMQCYGCFPEAQFARDLTIAALDEIAAKVCINKKIGITPLVGGKVLNGCCHARTIGKLLAVNVVTQVVM